MNPTMSHHAVLAETGLHLRACRILGIRSIQETTSEAYMQALIQAHDEGAGREYVESITGHVAGLQATEAPQLSASDRSEALHRSAVSYLEATGKANYTAEEYIAAVARVESTQP